MPKQTQGATFGERVNAGLAAAGSALASGAGRTGHDATMNSVRNMKSVAEPGGSQSSGAATPGAAKQGVDNSTPNRISMSVTIARRTQRLELDGEIMTFEVCQDGVITGRVSAP